MITKYLTNNQKSPRTSHQRMRRAHLTSVCATLFAILFAILFVKSIYIYKNGLSKFQT